MGEAAWPFGEYRRATLGLQCDVSPLHQKPHYEQCFTGKCEGCDAERVTRYEHSAEAVDEITAAGDDEQDTENPGHVARLVCQVPDEDKT